MHGGKMCFFATVHLLVHYISVNIKLIIFSQFNSTWKCWNTFPQLIYLLYTT